MFCKNCGKEMKDGSAFCAECGTMTESSNVKQVSSEMPVSNTNTSVISPEMTKKKYPVKLLIGAIITAFVIIIIVIACAVGDDDSETGVDNNTYFEDAVGDSEENVVKTLAIETVREQIGISHDEDVFDVEIIDSDGKFNYIVSASTEDNHGFETWWYILLKFDTETGKMQKYIHYHGEDDFNGELNGDRFTRDNIPEYYRTSDKFGWGEENHIK